MVLVKLLRYLLLALASFVGLFAAFYFLRGHPGGKRAGVLEATAWQRMASPGALSQAHTHLEHECAACHSSSVGVEAASCIVCHANNLSLLQRQPTTFHADVSSCSECHQEHQGLRAKSTVMDHAALSLVGLRQLKSNPDPATEDRLASAHFSRWILQKNRTATSGDARTPLTAEEMTLNCAACHGSKDRHIGLFGQDCSQCHSSVAWTIPEFRHPPPTSLDCAQCHQAPPSHYMMHFKMISMKTAGVEKAEVNQCFLCHQTTSWNDIKNVGWYKHH